LLARLVLLGSLALARVASADTAELLIYFDLDRQPATGCAGATSEGVVSGVELRLRARVDLDTHEVGPVTYASCSDSGSGFGAELSVHGPVSPPWATVPGDGSSGSTLIEAYLPLSAAPFATTVDLFVALDAPAGGDALLTTDGSAGGGPISLVLRAAAVPAAPAWLLACLGLALLALVHVAAPRRLARWLAIAIAASPVLVHASLGDGTLRTWSPAEAVALDLRGDAPEGADLLGAFAFVDAAQGVVFLRADAFFGPPICLDWPTVDPGSGYSCSQEPPPDPASGFRFALTFDDGPNPATTPAIVAALRAEGVPATFFVQGNRLDSDAARALAREVHEDPLFRVANHSFSHPSFTSLTVEQMRAEVTLTTERLRQAFGDACYFPRYFRFPYAATNCTAIGVVREQGLSTVGMHLDTQDWCYGSGNGTCSLLQSIPEQYRSDLTGYVLYRAQQTGGGIVLMHDIWPNTVQHLPGILAGLRAAGASFVTLDDASVFPLINAAVNVPEPPACCDGEVR
jgi:peptidoglycan/xylan/chitin deacetylase (PgdA/CDA1 family)